MRWPLTSILLLATVALGVVSWSAAPMPPATGAGQPVDRVAAAAAVTAVRFVPNRGQWHDEVRYAAIGDTAGWLHDDGFTLRFERWREPGDGSPTAAVAAREQSGCVVRTRIVDAQRPTIVPGRELPSRQHFFLGADPERWCADVPGFATVALQGVLPGIDVVFRPLPEGRRGPFEYDLVLAPGADLSRFVAVCEGVDALRIDAEGRLCASISTPNGGTELVQDTPISWQDTPAGRVPLRVAFRLLGTRSYGFVATDLDPTWPATVDPGVLWGTYLGGGASDSINDLHWQPGVGIWVAGWAGSTDFPTTVGAYRTTGGSDAFLARLTEDGNSLVFSTYLGGSAGEEVRGVAVGPANTATVVGFTASTDFPTTPGALQPVYQGASPFIGIGDAFLVRFAASGAALIGATYLGGSSDDIAEDVHVDASGNAVVTGFTFSANFPITPLVWQPTFGSFPDIDSDGFVARVSANAQSLLYSTFVGGLASEQLLEVDVDPATGDVVVAGWSLSHNYPTTLNAYRSTSGGDIEAVVTRLNSTGTAAVFSTFLGGVASESAHDVRFAADGSVWVGGRTLSTNFPVTMNAPQRTNAGEFDGFVSHLSANGQSLLFSTLLGGPGVDSVRSIDVLAGGVVVVGETGPGFPVTSNPIQGQFAGGSIDGFISYLTAGGTVLSYSSYLGGTNQDVLGSVQIDGSGMAVVAGWSFSTDFPIAPAGYQDTMHGVQDGVVLKIDLLSQLGEGFRVTGPVPTAPQIVTAGPQQLLAAQIENLTDRDLTVDAVRVLVAGSGSAPQHVQALRVWLDVPSAAAATLVAGPIAVPVDDDELQILLVGALLPARAVGTLRIECDLTADAAGRTIELAGAIVDRDAWQLRASGVGPGPTIRVLGTGRAAGQVLVHGALPGDADGDGEATVFDVRRLLSQLGAGAAAIDCDGDQVVTMADVGMTRNAVLGRPSLIAGPAVVAAGQWFTVRGVFGAGVLEATLGGRVLVPGRVTPREITLRVDAAQPKGTHDLVVLLGGRQVFLGPVLVQ